MRKINIKYDEKEILYAGDPIELEAGLTNPENYYFGWVIDKGNFKPDSTSIDIDGKSFQIAASSEPKTSLSTEPSMIGQQIYVFVFAVKRKKVDDLKPKTPLEAICELAKNHNIRRAKPEVSNDNSLEIDKCDSGEQWVPKSKFKDLTTTGFNQLFEEKADQLTDKLNDVRVSLRRTAIPNTGDIGLWHIIRNSTQALNFNNYKVFMNRVLCDDDPDLSEDEARTFRRLGKARRLPFNDTDAYRLLKVATEAFMLTNGAVALDDYDFSPPEIQAIEARIGGVDQEAFQLLWDEYMRLVNGDRNPMLPYLALVSNQFDRDAIRKSTLARSHGWKRSDLGRAENCLGFLSDKAAQPFLVELIWSYWHEEGMLVQTMNAISRRFQNFRSPNGSRDPLANLEIDPLRGLNNLLWGYVQDEQHRLSLVRRVYEYDHHYGIALQGKAVPKLRPADSRSKFIEAFHNLLHLCSVFYRQDDDTTVNTDGFPLLNALREVHLILSHGAHNQFGDLPSTARQEMLLQQWLLARPEFREFLPTRNMVAYPEPWMNRVDAMKSLQGWTDISIDHFNRLAVFGEQILLSIRFGAWSHINQFAPNAANWARFWRAEIQGYIHDYRAVTGVDLTSPAKVDSTPPSIHLFRRYLEQARR